MSYQVLARKWRPQNFQQVIGQAHVLTALENALTQNRVHHAYLFSGTRGVGKTTIARIFAKSLNCEIGVTATPCGKCANCIAIDQGRFVDLLEIDAASRTKVDDTRELLDNVQYKPAQGRYKVYLIDEVHMLSKHSFNALLKTLEEPPEYVKFLLATTDPKKLPITVLSRCLQFHLKAIAPEQIEQQLVTILQHEKAPFEQAALGVIAKAADGSMRDALSLTDQALAFGAGHIEYAAVLKMLGTIDHAHLHYLLHFIASGNSAKVFDKIQEFVHLGADFSALHQELASLCHQIALIQLQPNPNITEKTTVQLLAERLTPEEVQLFYQIAVQGYKDYAYAPNGKIALEMTVMRLLAFKPANYVEVEELIFNQVQTTDIIQTTRINSPAINTIASPTTTSTPPALVEPVIVLSAQAEQITAVENNRIANDQATVENNQAVVPNEQTIVENNQAVVLNEQTIVENNQAVVPNEQTIVENNQPVSEPFTVSFDSTNSRNMLRSHRLKREALKKTDAAAEHTHTDIERPVALKKTSFKPNQRSFTATLISANPIDNGVPDSKPAFVSNNTSMAAFHNETTNDQELPPLSSYQDQQVPEPFNSDDYAEDRNANEGSGGDRPCNDPHENENENERLKHFVSDLDRAKNHNELTQTAFDADIQIDSQRMANNASIDIDHSYQSRTDTHYDRLTTTALTPSNGSTEVVLIGNENTKKADIDIASYVDDKMTDTWFLAIKAMCLVGLEKLLAKNTVMQQGDNDIILTIAANQQHLLNNHKVCDDLKSKLRDYYGSKYVITIQNGNTLGKHTPLELEAVVYQTYLDNAKISIKNDPIVQLFVRDYAAKVYENSVVPL